MDEIERGFTLKELLSLMKRVWVFMLAAAIIGFAASILKGVLDKEVYKAERYIEVRLPNFVSREDETITNNMLEKEDNIIYYCFHNDDSKINAVKDYKNISESSALNDINVSLQQSVLILSYTNVDKEIAAKVLDNYIEISKTKVSDKSVVFNDIMPTVITLQNDEIGGRIVSAVMIGAVAAVGLYVLVFCVYCLSTKLSTKKSVERMTNMDITGAFNVNNSNEQICLNELYVNIRNKTKENIIICTDNSENSSCGILKLAKSFVANNKKTVVIDCNYAEKSIFRNKFSGEGITAATSSNYKDLVKDFEGIDIIPSNGLNSDSAGFISSATMNGLIEKLCADYDVVLIYAAPLNIYSDALIFTEEDKAALLVSINFNDMSVRSFNAVREKTSGVKSNLIGSFVVNANNYFIEN